MWKKTIKEKLHQYFASKYIRLNDKRQGIQQLDGHSLERTPLGCHMQGNFGLDVATQGYVLCRVPSKLYEFILGLSPKSFQILWQTIDIFFSYSANRQTGSKTQPPLAETSMMMVTRAGNVNKEKSCSWFLHYTSVQILDSLKVLA